MKTPSSTPEENTGSRVQVVDRFPAAVRKNDDGNYVSKVGPVPSAQKPWIIRLRDLRLAERVARSLYPVGGGESTSAFSRG